MYGAARSGVRVDTIANDSQLLEMDVTSEESVAAAVALILRKHKVCFLLPLALVSHSKTKTKKWFNAISSGQRIDVVVNNAGINQANVLRAINASSAMKPMNTNFAGVIRVNEKVCPASAAASESPPHARTSGHPQHDRIGQVTSLAPAIPLHVVH